MTMTVDEYARVIANKLVHAYNRKDRNALLAIFDEADQSLDESYIRSATREKFWEDVREIVVNSDQLLFERQSNSALIALMQMMQQQLAARAGGNSGRAGSSR